ncbi:MAG: isochorismate synthase [Sulfuricellaceae bacterium]
MLHNTQLRLSTPTLETRLADLLHRHGGGRGKGLLSITVALPERAFDSLPFGLDEHHYWANPAEGISLFGVGRAAQVETQGEGRFRALDAAFSEYRRLWEALDVDDIGIQPAALAGFAFDRNQRGAFLPNARLTVPALLLQRHGGTCAATFSCDRESAAAHVLAAWMRNWRSLAVAHFTQAPPVGALSRMKTQAADAAWLALAQQAVDDIRSGALNKVVLSRRMHMRACRSFDPAAVMAALAARYADCYQFSHAENGLGVFLGATPERLVALRGGQVVSEALAGTAWDAASLERLSDDKNLREHRLVLNAIVRALEAACSFQEIPARPSVRELRDLFHLRSVVKARAKPDVTLLNLVERLHPTPAVGGHPTRRAQDWLASHGETRPAWYSGATGWLGLDGDGDFAVALRCAWIHGNEAELYAGAGIVAGSDPATELAETEAKFKAILDALA